MKEKKVPRQVAHIIKAESSIIALIKKSQSHLIMMTARFPGEKQSFNTSIIKVDYQNQLFYLDEFAPYDGNTHLNKVKKVYLKSYLDNCVLSMECHLKEQKEAKGLLYSIMYFPRAIKSVQHREFYRINIPRTHHLQVLLRKESGELLTGELNDISYNGISIRFRTPQNINVNAQEIIPIVKIHLTEKVVINCTMQIKRIFSLSDNQIIAGILDEVPPAQQQKIQKFITHMERQKKRSEEN